MGCLLFKQPERRTRARPLPDWAVVHRELRRKGVTLWLLWEEYCAAHAGAACYSYTRSCELSGAWPGLIDVVMRQTHAPGEKLFVAVFGASNYTFVVATEGQDLKSWIGAHEEAFRFLGGEPRIVVPDNLKAGVSKAHRSAVGRRR